MARKDANDRIYKTRREKYNAVINEIRECHAKAQPVLVGTVSVEASRVAQPNAEAGKNSAQRAQREISHAGSGDRARAGQPGTVTISTNMAGRGTDIKLGAGVAELGGLARHRHRTPRIAPHRSAVARPLRAPGRSRRIALLRQLRRRSDAQLRRGRSHDENHGTLRPRRRPGARASVVEQIGRDGAETRRAAQLSRSANARSISTT